LLCPEKKLMCLSGTGALATVFEVNSLTLMAKCNLVTPTIDALCECMTAIEVAEVEAPDENGLVTYPGSASFLPAPWLADAVIQQQFSTKSTKKTRTTSHQRQITQVISSFGLRKSELNADGNDADPDAENRRDFPKIIFKW
jgi:hypothetical protein